MLLYSSSLHTQRTSLSIVVSFMSLYSLIILLRSYICVCLLLFFRLQQRVQSLLTCLLTSCLLLYFWVKITIDLNLFGSGNNFVGCGSGLNSRQYQCFQHHDCSQFIRIFPLMKPIFVEKVLVFLDVVIYYAYVRMQNNIWGQG